MNTRCARLTLSRLQLCRRLTPCSTLSGMLRHTLEALLPSCCTDSSPINFLPIHLAMLAEGDQSSDSGSEHEHSILSSKPWKVPRPCTPYSLYFPRQSGNDSNQHALEAKSMSITQVTGQKIIDIKCSAAQHEPTVRVDTPAN